MSENGKYWNPSIYEYSIMCCTVSYWILGEHGVRERVSKGEVFQLKHNIYRPEVPRWTSGISIYTQKQWSAGGQIGSLPGWGQVGMGGVCKEWRWIWWIYFVFIYKNRRMKSVETVLSRRRGRKTENNGKGKSN
jgi:hypothetical protein